MSAVMENYNLMWGDFTSNLSMTVKDLRNEKDFLDVSIACEDEIIEAHKVILSAASPFFKNILRKTSPHIHPFIYLNGIKFKDMKNLIDFMYNGEATVSHEDLDKFMSVANDLKVKGLTRSDFSESSTKYLGNIVAAEPEPEPASVPLALDTSRKPVASKSKAPTVAASPHRFVSQTPKIIKANASYITSPGTGTAPAAPAGSVMVPTPQVQFQTPTYQLSVLPDTQDHFIKREEVAGGESSKHVYLAPKSETPDQANLITLHDGSAASLGQLATVATTDRTDPALAELNEQISSLILKYRKEETNKLVWRCTVCNRESDHLSNMRSHVELHIQINRSCDECGKTFNTKNSLRIHKYRSHSQKAVVTGVGNSGAVAMVVDSAAGTAGGPTPVLTHTNTLTSSLPTSLASVNTTQ